MYLPLSLPSSVSFWTESPALISMSGFDVHRLPSLARKAPIPNLGSRTSGSLGCSQILVPKITATNPQYGSVRPRHHRHRERVSILSSANSTQAGEDTKATIALTTSPPCARRISVAFCLDSSSSATCTNHILLAFPPHKHKHRRTQSDSPSPLSPFTKGKNVPRA